MSRRSHSGAPGRLAKPEAGCGRTIPIPSRNRGPPGPAKSPQSFSNKNWERCEARARCNESVGFVRARTIYHRAERRSTPLKGETGRANLGQRCRENEGV